MTTSITVPETITSEVDKVIWLVKLSDTASAYTRGLLYKIREEESWKDKFSSWAEFIEGGLGKSQGWASVNCAVYKHFVLDGGIPESDIEFDTSRLYLAAKTAGTAEEQLAKATTLTRAELRLERNEKEPHAYNPYEACKDCGGSKETHGV